MLAAGIALTSGWSACPAVGDPGAVRVQETGAVYDTLKDAITGVEADSLTTFTLVVTDDIAEPGVITIASSNVTIVGDGGTHTVTGFAVKETGGSLTLGDGGTPDNLTLSGAVQVKAGSIEIDDGVALINPNNSDPANPGSCNAGAFPALDMDGATVFGRITGGVIKGCTALRQVNGAHITEITGGDFLGLGASAEVEKSIIDVISGGLFQKSSTVIARYAFTLDSGSHIGLISGGVFDSMNYSGSGALLVIRGSWIDEISGGQFLAPAAYDNPAVTVMSGGITPTGIGTISGGTFIGAPVAGVTPDPTPASSAVGLGMWVQGAGARVGSITGGTFKGERAIEPDVGTVIGSISGGQFISTSLGTRAGYGMLNAGTIGEIGGTAQFTGRNAGVWNYSGAVIDEISGGTISSSGTYAFGNGISNSGTITLISGGIISGDYNAIYSNYGHVDTITNGVFWGKAGETFYLRYPVSLEPGLATDIGAGRYQSGAGEIFNDESLVTYPADYYMSTDTMAVESLGAGFRYLALPVTEPPVDPPVDPPVVPPVVPPVDPPVVPPDDPPINPPAINPPAIAPHQCNTGGSPIGGFGMAPVLAICIVLLGGGLLSLRRLANRWTAGATSA